MGKFGTGVAKWADKMIEESGDRVRFAASAWFGGTVNGTPVGNPDNWDSLWKWTDGSAANPPAGYVGGRLKANWQISTGTPAQGEINAIDGSESGGPTINNIEGFLGSLNFKKDQKIYLTNNLPYIIPIEYGGHSKQAPEGMARTSLMKVERAIGRRRVK